MTHSRSELEQFIQALFEQPSWEQVIHILQENSDLITEEFLRMLAEIGSSIRQGANFNDALSVFAIALTAARLVENAKYILMYLSEMVLSLRQMGQIEQNRQLLQQAYSEADDLARDGNSIAIQCLISFGQQLAEIEIEHHNTAAARDILARSRRRCYEAGSRAGELWLTLGLIRVCLLEEDFATVQKI